MIKNTSGLAVQPCRLHERFYYHARLLYYILRQKARGFFDAGAEAPADPFFLSASPEGFCGDGSPSTHQWAYPAHTRGSFRFTTKGTKGVPGAAPLDPGAWLPHFPRSLRFAPARAVLLPAFLPAALQARQHGGHIPPRLSPPPFGTLIACGFPFPYPAKKLLDARWAVQGVHSR